MTSNGNGNGNGNGKGKGKGKMRGFFASLRMTNLSRRNDTLK
jgi:hypothetical protein